MIHNTHHTICSVYRSFALGFLSTIIHQYSCSFQFDYLLTWLEKWTNEIDGKSNYSKCTEHHTSIIPFFTSNLPVYLRWSLTAFSTRNIAYEYFIILISISKNIAITKLLEEKSIRILNLNKMFNWFIWMWPPNKINHFVIFVRQFLHVIPIEIRNSNSFAIHFPIAQCYIFKVAWIIASSCCQQQRKQTKRNILPMHNFYPNFETLLRLKVC